jgi:NAD-dependent protein deacetylase/lipoamidase
MSLELSPSQCAELIRGSKRVIALTGAGVSTAAGVADFRGPNGIYRTGQYDPDRVFDIEHFRRDPREFFRFARDLAGLMESIEPTFTHRFLARLEAEGMLLGVITQNVDPLHHLAGSKHVVSIHGDFAGAHCMKCGRAYTYAETLERMSKAEIPRCDCTEGGVIKPDVVFFGEQLSQWPEAADLAAACDLMLTLGSSLQVHPASMLPRVAPGAVVVVNQGSVRLEPGPGRYFVDADLDEYFRAVSECLFEGSAPLEPDSRA